jgi:hypothetical protein
MKHIGDSTYQEATAPPTSYPPQEEIEDSGTSAPKTRKKLILLGGETSTDLKGATQAVCRLKEGLRN